MKHKYLIVLLLIVFSVFGNDNEKLDTLKIATDSLYIVVQGHPKPFLKDEVRFAKGNFRYNLGLGMLVSGVVGLKYFLDKKILMQQNRQMYL